MYIIKDVLTGEYWAKSGRFGRYQNKIANARIFKAKGHSN